VDLVPLTDNELESRQSLKWNRARPGTVPADIAEADFAVAKPILQVLTAAVAHSDLGYPDFDSDRGGPQRLGEVFADRMHNKFNVPADPRRVEVCAQIMQALCCVILVYSQPGDLILVHEPTYPPMARAIGDLNRRPIAVPVPDRDSGDYAELLESVGSKRIAIIILCNPHNPTGRLFTASQLGALADLAERHESVIFADEIHHDLTYETPHLSIAAIDSAASRSIVFTSAAKSFNIAGLRCAVGHFGSHKLLQEYRKLPWHLRSGASILGIEATIAAWSTCEPWLNEFRALLQRNRLLISEALAASKTIYTPPEATYFAWLDLKSISGDPDPVHMLGEERNILLQNGASFGQGYSNFARLNFAVPERRLRTILSEIVLSRDHRESP